MQIKSIHVSQVTLDSIHSVVRELPNSVSISHELFEEVPSGRCSALLESNFKLYKISLVELTRELLTSEATFNKMKAKLKSELQKNVVYSHMGDKNEHEILIGMLKISVPKNILTSSGAIGFPDVEAEKRLNLHLRGFKSTYDKTKDRTDIQIDFAAFGDFKNIHFIDNKTNVVGKK